MSWKKSSPTRVKQSPFPWMVGISLVLLSLFCLHLPFAEAKRKRAYRPPPLKVLDVSMDPVPFTPGKHPLEITIEVELPAEMKGRNLLEVSSLISFPTKRSIRFLAHRQPVVRVPGQIGKQKVHAVLFWDGKDQRNEFVIAGQYEYEIRAKLMAIGENGPRTTMVSVRARGELDVEDPQMQKTFIPPTH